MRSACAACSLFPRVIGNAGCAKAATLGWAPLAAVTWAWPLDRGFAAASAGGAVQGAAGVELPGGVAVAALASRLLDLARSCSPAPETTAHAPAPRPSSSASSRAAYKSQSAATRWACTQAHAHATCARPRTGLYLCSLCVCVHGLQKNCN